MTQAQGRTVELTVGPVAHGGHFVARYEGRVIFVRHGLPGERVMARLTDSSEDAKFWRADVVEVLDAAPGRREHFWAPADALAAAGRRVPAVGGAEFGHIELSVQRELKATVIAEQLQRLAGLETSVEVEAVEIPGAGEDGLHWRTRASYAVGRDGRLGMHAHRSDRIIPVQEMPLASEQINALRLWELDLNGIERIEVAAPANGSAPLVLLNPAPGTSAKRLSAILAGIDPAASVATFNPGGSETLRLRGRTWLSESVGSHEYRVTGEGFWQIHRRAPQTLSGAVQEFLNDGGYLTPGANVADLYAGAGLFTAPLAQAVGESGAVLSVEGAPGASRDARKNLHGIPQVEIVQGRVESVLRRQPRAFDAIVLDPPRAGAGTQVVKQLIASSPRAIAYVACDPASFARDLGYFRNAGWKLAQLRAFDLYPNTHHVETVALLLPASS
ncbi:class I SAM-dependent RNA methyltransferase [Pseudarthrobacter sp. J1738]|uniref:class I SAM-dependent RNA methyltransferase n=1 Tax=Pseudarthrobacter sp. J1738 TaxID=3420446 RepID=UPI003D272CE6